MDDNRHQARTESSLQQQSLVFNSEGDEVHPETVEAVRDFKEQFREALKELVDR